MNKVYQTRFGGSSAELIQQGNCFQACVATVLQMPIEEAFDAVPWPDDIWFEEFNKWLAKYNLGCVWLESSGEHPAPASKFLGIHIAECKSDNLYNGGSHAVVIEDGYLLHDPLPNATRQGEYQGIYIFVPLRPYSLVRIRS